MILVMLLLELLRVMFVAVNMITMIMTVDDCVFLWTLALCTKNFCTILGIKERASRLWREYPNTPKQHVAQPLNDTLRVNTPPVTE